MTDRRTAISTVGAERNKEAFDWFVAGYMK